MKKVSWVFGLGFGFGYVVEWDGMGWMSGVRRKLMWFVYLED